MLPNNHGRPWTKEAEQQVKHAFLNGATVREIAALMGRSEVSINCVLYRLKVIDERGNPIVTEPSETKQHKETKMAFSLVVENKTFINGKDAATMSDEEYFGLIRRAEQELAELDQIQHKPKIVQVKKEQLLNDIMKIVCLLDDRAA